MLDMLCGDTRWTGASQCEYSGSVSLKNHYLIVVVCLLVTGVVCAQEVARYEAVCRPSKEVTLAFTRPGQIETIFVQVGDTVTEGQPLVQLENSVEQAQVEQLKNEAEDATHIEAAEAELEQSQVDLNKIQEAFDAKAVTEFELDHAKLDVKIKELSLKLAKFKQAQNHRRYEEAALQLDRMAIASPISGTVEILYVESGESIDQLDEVIHLVETDPLWVDVPVPLSRAAELKVGDVAEVFLSTNPDEVVAGTVVFVASVADAASETLRVRVELPNADHAPAGQHVFIAFPPAQVESEINRMSIGLGVSATKGLHVALDLDHMPDDVDEASPEGDTDDAPDEDVENETEPSGEAVPDTDEVNQD
jgi:RND family efflux transporter MFP subunit